MPGLITWTSQVSTPDSRLAQEWWDVKGVVKALTPDATNPDPFKQGARSPLRDLPLGDCTKYIKIDPAHTFAIDGVGKDFLASSIIILCRAGHFGNGSIPHRFQNAYSNFIAFCNARKKNTSISEFDYSTFKLPQNSFLALWRLVSFWHLNVTIEQLKWRYMFIFYAVGTPHVWDSAIDRTLVGYPENRLAYLKDNG